MWLPTPLTILALLSLTKAETLIDETSPGTVTLYKVAEELNVLSKLYPSTDKSFKVLSLDLFLENLII